MFIRFFKAKYFIQFAALFLLAAVLWIDMIIDPSTLQIGGDSNSFFGLTGILQGYPIILVIISILLLIFQAIVLNQILENHRLMERNQLLTAATYILIVSSSTILTNPIGILFTNLILIIQLNIVLNIYGKKEPYREVFDAGFLIGTASLLHFPVLIFILFLWACLVLYQIFTWREWLIPIIGISIPHLFAGTYFYWSGNFETEFSTLITFFSNLHPLALTGSIYLYTIWGFLTLLTFISFRQISKGLTGSTISIRKKSRVLVIFLIISLTSAIFSGDTLMTYLVIATIPVSAFISLYLSRTKKHFIPEVIILLLFLSILVGKYINLA
jgi:hypothetical protein